MAARRKAEQRNASPDELSRYFRDIGEQLGEAIGSSMVETLRASLPKVREEMLGAAATRRLAAGERRGAKVSASLTRPCPVPGCTRPGRGPRFSFLCEIHRELPASEREKYRIRPRRG